MDEKQLQDVLQFRTKCNVLVQNLEEMTINNSCADDFLKREIDTVLRAIHETAFGEGGYVESDAGKQDQKKVDLQKIRNRLSVIRNRVIYGVSSKLNLLFMEIHNFL